MPAIVRSAVLACAFAAALSADAHDDVTELVTSMAGALTQADVPEFMDAFDKNMPDYGTLEAEVTALVTQTEISSDIEPLTASGNNQTYSIDLDWFLQVRSLQQVGPITRRRQIVHCELRKIKKHWKIVAIKPVDFFAAPKTTP
ncbi:MAG TPA: hypothetical protein VMB25_20975 [Bryobacteraceae bacterium]|nr:hypothetical protein [Bryobacteraceae bacterium]